MRASVAQLDRASPSDGEGCGFKSRRVRHRYKLGLRRANQIGRSRSSRLPILLASSYAVAFRSASPSGTEIVTRSRGSAIPSRAGLAPHKSRRVRHRYKLGLRRANQIGRSRSSRLPILLASSYAVAFRSASPSGTEIVTRSRGSAIPSRAGLAPHKSRRVRHRYKLGLRRANQIGRSRSSRLPILLASSYAVAFRSASPSGTEIVTRSRGSAIPSRAGLAPHKSRRVRHRYKLGLRRANQIGRSRSSRLPILLASSYAVAFRSASPSGTEIVTRSRGSAIPSRAGLAPHKSRRVRHRYKLGLRRANQIGRSRSSRLPILLASSYAVAFRSASPSGTEIVTRSRGSAIPSRAGLAPYKSRRLSDSLLTACFSTRKL